jgi:hypothetical protein
MKPKTRCAVVLAAGINSRWLRGASLAEDQTTAGAAVLHGRRVLAASSRIYDEFVDARMPNAPRPRGRQGAFVTTGNETADVSNVTEDVSNVTEDVSNVTVTEDVPNVTEEAVTETEEAAPEVTEEATPNVTEEVAPDVTEEAAPNVTDAAGGNLSDDPNMTALTNMTNDTTALTNMTNDTTDNATNMSNATNITVEEPVPMDGSAVQRPPPQFVVDFCGEQAEQMTACYSWVTTMHGCYTNCKQTAQINTLEADVGGCLAAMCGYVPPLICGAADSGGICSVDGPENADSSVEHCDRQCENFLGCVTFQTKGQCAMKRTAALFEECYDQCVTPDVMAFSPRIPEPGDPTR